MEKAQFILELGNHHPRVYCVHFSTARKYTWHEGNLHSWEYFEQHMTSENSKYQGSGIGAYHNQGPNFPWQR